MKETNLIRFPFPPMGDFFCYFSDAKERFILETSIRITFNSDVIMSLIVTGCIFIAVDSFAKLSKMSIKNHAFRPEFCKITQIIFIYMTQLETFKLIKLINIQSFPDTKFVLQP